jgi:hypothetical protein
MQSKAATVTDYIDSLPPERKQAVSTIRKTILKHLPKGFAEVMNYGMIGYVVPHQLYRPGYHVDPRQPLPFLGLASQKNYISFYHMALYDRGPLHEWLVDAWPEATAQKLDMGKCCVRLKKPEDIPLDVIAELVKKMTPAQWIAAYEQNLKKSKTAKK